MELQSREHKMLMETLAEEKREKERLMNKMRHEQMQPSANEVHVHVIIDNMYMYSTCVQMVFECECFISSSRLQ